MSPPLPMLDWELYFIIVVLLISALSFGAYALIVIGLSAWWHTRHKRIDGPRRHEGLKLYIREIMKRKGEGGDPK
jgi:hypothetical protein